MKANKYSETLFQNAKGSTFRNAKFLRRNETNAERIHWESLRKKGLGDYKIRRQHPIGKFVADFYCAKKKLVIELDGSMHFYKETRDYDKLRTELSKEKKITVLRFKNSEVENDIKGVLLKISNALESLH